MLDHYDVPYTVDYYVDYDVTSELPPSNQSNHSLVTSTHERDEGLAKIEVAVQALIFVLALIGNSCVLIALSYRKKKTSRMHLFIMHLSIADLLVAFFNVLPQMAWDITYRFKGNDFLCRSVKYMQVMVMYLSTYVLVMTAIDRYRAIVHPLSNYSCSSSRAYMMIAMAWILSLVFSLPQIVIFRLTEVSENSGVYDCWAHFYPQWTGKLYITFFAVAIYIIPFLILVLLYGRICFEVWKNCHRKGAGSLDCTPDGRVVYKFNGTGTISVISAAPHAESTSCPQETLHNCTNERHTMIPRSHTLRGFSRSKMKTIKLTFVVIVAYVFCWSPFFITQMWWAYDDTAPYNNATFVICLLLGSLNSCCNPWIYMLFSGSLMQQLFPCCRRHQPPLCRQRVNSVIQVQNRRKSYTSSSSQKRDARDLENRLNNVLDLDHNRHKHGCTGTRKPSLNTSSTKLTQSVSPHGSWRTRNNFLVARAHEPMAFNHKPTTYNKEEILERKREGRLLNQIDEEKTGGIQREASSGSNYKANQYHSPQTSSYPTLLFNKPSIYEKVDTRCTSV